MVVAVLEADEAMVEVVVKVFFMVADSVRDIVAVLVTDVVRVE